MKVGDLVTHSRKIRKVPSLKVGLIVELKQKKCWRTNRFSQRINWDLVEPELHAVVMYPGQDCIAIPAVELEVVSEK